MTTLQNMTTGGYARVDVLGVGISAIDPDDALGEVTRWIDNGIQHYVCVTGVHGVMESQGDADLLRIHNESGLTTPDGMPMVWAARLAGAKNTQRVYGPDLMLAVCERAAQRGWGCFLYGATDEVLDQLRSNLADRFPGLKITGTHSPPFRPLTPEEDAAVVREINESGAQIVWVGLSTPKQERWMASHIGRLNACAIFGVGAAFDMHAGMLRQAPRWMQRSGLEWLFRLASEPRRLWRRYAVNNPRFVLAISRRRPRISTAGVQSEKVIRLAEPADETSSILVDEPSERATVSGL
ncbi:MAG: N-acetylglucosaminyldiphosphoundecaprenol N-acetyl-beta-D-mannosaminyltransferase [Actinomycetota bacterium]|nr:N-acetylglucosaminyldiphosphoundecaprenol N-acetyl-beta-D-mannosaminyltransferase [Actinomycetota bacterium]